MATRGGVPIFFGSNQDVFLQIKYGLDDNGRQDPVDIHSVPGLNGIRIYGTKPADQESILPPTSWPAGPTYVISNPRPYTIPYSGPIVYSIYPDPRQVLEPDSVALANINSLIASAPPNSYLNAWHEGLSLKHPDYITGGQQGSLFALHTILNSACLGTNVTYGAILSTTDPWDSVPDNLGFYGFDVYNNLGTGLTQLDGLINTAKSHFTCASSGTCPPGTVPGYPNVLIGETNMPPNATTGSTALRGPWFEDVCNRMKTYGTNAIGVLTFWKDGGNLGGPWLPFDTTTEDDMSNCADTIF
jgi:hypothetical protein